MNIPYHRVAEGPDDRSGWYFTWPTDHGPHEVKGPFCSYLRCIAEQRRLRAEDDAWYDTYDEDLEP